ncbi:hypothetical protein [Streptosporangium sp. NPDC049644]|uniref:hypothetical protein n=1 Tax=Streptosporangium sp. NPDC049644 TaxID=3155507 RepID=UPI0034345390
MAPGLTVFSNRETENDRQVAEITAGPAVSLGPAGVRRIRAPDEDGLRIAA